MTYPAEHVLVDDFAESDWIPERRAQLLFIESLVPEDDLDSAELVELWMIAELDAGIEALVDGAEFEVDDLVRSTPTPKTGALPGLAMVHYERVVYWSEAAEAFTIDADEPEDALDWTDLDPELDAEIEADAELDAEIEADPALDAEPFDADEGDLCGPDAEADLARPCLCNACTDARALS